MNFRFNTGRGYQPKGHEFAGQVIDVEATTDGTTYTVKFWDRSRGIDGAFTMPDWSIDHRSLEAYLRESVMHFYDENRYQQLDYFEYLHRSRA